LGENSRHWAIVAKSIADYFQDQKNQDFLARLVDAGVKIKYASTGGQKLVGLTFVLYRGTGKIYSREKAKRKKCVSKAAKFPNRSPKKLPMWWRARTPAKNTIRAQN